MCIRDRYRQDENYKNLLHKEFDILISLQHPNIVSAYSMEEIPEIDVYKRQELGLYRICKYIGSSEK